MPGSEEALNRAKATAESPECSGTPILRRFVVRLVPVLRSPEVLNPEITVAPAQVHGVGAFHDFGAVMHDVRESGVLHFTCSGVCNGLSSIATEESAEQPDADSAARGLPVPDVGVRTLRLILAPRVRVPWLPRQRTLRVRGATLLEGTSVRSPRWSEAAEMVRTRAIAMIGPSFVAGDDDRTFLAPSRCYIRDATEQARTLQHSRTGVPPEEISPNDAALLTREAEELRGIAAGRAEIVTLFRRVPIEVISGIRLTDNATKLQFEVTVGRNRTRARVHDLAAVRDTGDSTVHLVPNRTNHRTANLA